MTRYATTWGQTGNKKGLPLNLQLFAENTADDDAPTLYTQEEVERLIQSEADKRVTEALKTSREKMEKEFAKRLKDEKDEAARMARLSEEERARELFEQEKKALDAEKAALQRERLEMEIAKQLTEHGLNAGFAKFLMGKDADESKANIDAFRAAWGENLEAAVNEKLSGRPPQAGAKNLMNENPFSKDHYNLTKQAELLKTNPELYRELKAAAEA